MRTSSPARSTAAVGATASPRGGTTCSSLMNRGSGHVSVRVGFSTPRCGIQYVEGSPSYAICAPTPGSSKNVEDARTRTFLLIGSSSRWVESAGSATTSPDSSQVPPSCTVISRKIPDCSSLGRAWLSSEQPIPSPTSMQARRCGRARNTKSVLASAPLSGTTSLRSSVDAREVDVPDRDDPLAAGHLGHRHPHPVDAAAVEGHPDVGRRGVDRRPGATWSPAVTSISRTGTPAMPSVAGRTST